MKHLFVLAAAALLALGASSRAEVKSEPAKPNTAGAEPKNAAEVFDRYAAAAGGEALNKVKSRATKGVFEMPAFGMKANMETFTASPGRFYSLITSDAGTIERGFDGKVGWNKDPFGGGLRDMNSRELKDVQLDANLQLPLKLKELHPEAKLKGKQTLEGKENHVVEIQDSGKAHNMYFDVATGLLTRWDREVLSPDGPIAIEANWQDYREHDGVKVPHVLKLTAAQFAMTITYNEVKHNVEIANSKFVKPSE